MVLAHPAGAGALLAGGAAAAAPLAAAGARPAQTVVTASLSDLTQAFKLANAPESKKDLVAPSLWRANYDCFPTFYADVAFLAGGIPVAMWDYPFLQAMPTQILKYSVKLLANVPADKIASLNSALSQVLSPESYLCRGDRCWKFGEAFGKVKQSWS